MRQALAAAPLLIAGIGPAAADGEHLGAGWMAMPEVMIRAYALGFTELTEIEAEDGVWKAKGFRDGVYTKIALDPRTGAVVPMPHKKRHARHDGD